MRFLSSVLSVGVASFFFPSVSVSAHTIMMNPVPRENVVHTNASPYECGTLSAVQATYQRGQVIDHNWGRNNHYGGFVQLSVLPLARAAGAAVNNDNIRAEFDNPANVVHVQCYNQQSCQACAGCADFLGRGGDGTNFQQNVCRSRMTIPTYLADGDYTFKWVVFGNGDSFGVRNLPHSSYSNCHNFRVQGGAALTQKRPNNAHIEFGAPGVGLYDHALTLIGQPQGKCLFQATNTHMGCRPIPNTETIVCGGTIADAARCGVGAQTDSRQTCLGFNNEGQLRQTDLFNYMIGLPPYAPAFNGQLQMVKESRQVVTVTVGGGNTNTGGGGNTNTGGGNTPAAAGAFGIVWFNKNPARVFDVAQNRNVNANRVQIWESYGPGTAQRWEITGTDGQIRWVGTDKCLDVSGGINVDGTQIQIWQCQAGNRNQQFVLVPASDPAARIIQWKNTNKCLGVAGGSADLGTPIQLVTCNAATPNQMFQMQPLLAVAAAPPVAASTFDDSARILMQNPWSVQFSWQQGQTPADISPSSSFASSQNSSLVVVPVGSTLKFVGASDTNPVRQVCADYVAYVTSQDPARQASLLASPGLLCNGQDTWNEVVGGEIVFRRVTGMPEVNYYFVGIDTASGTDRNQVLQVLASETLSTPELADQLNKQEDASSSSPSTLAPKVSGAVNNVNVVGGVVAATVASVIAAIVASMH